ncbi:hypothetical protein [Streptomyces tricolor]|uniref:hypothetical protein n=1 Tax=Streptomyces tricolor TaxID=68277 RepID=UPI0036EB1C87
MGACAGSRGAIRTAVADLLPDHTVIEQEDVPTPELPVTLDITGRLPTSSGGSGASGTIGGMDGIGGSSGSCPCPRSAPTPPPPRRTGIAR